MAFEAFDADVRGGRVHVRAILPTDTEEMLQAFERLGRDSRYMRFMATVRAPEAANLRRRLSELPAKGLAIAATVPAADGIDIVGSAAFILAAEPGDCEFSVTVTDAWAGKGLGGLLMRTLIAAARDRGLSAMHGFVLAENRPMLALAAKVGFSIASDPRDSTVRICRLGL